MLKYTFSFLLFLSLLACNTGDSVQPSQAANLPGFDISPVPGSAEFSTAEKRDPQTGNLLESGQLYNGKLSGTWISYNPIQRYIESLSTFVDGKRTGIYVEFNELGRIKRNANYLNDQLHGRDITYSRNTRMEKEAHYKNGQLHGKYREFDAKEKPTKEIQYKDGQLHGTYRFFNGEGKMTVEYIYENGTKVSGGAVTN